MHRQSHTIKLSNADMTGKCGSDAIIRVPEVKQPPKRNLFFMSQLFIAHGQRDIDPLLQVHEAMRRAAIPTWYTPPGAKDHDPDAINEMIDNAFDGPGRSIDGFPV